MLKFAAPHFLFIALVARNPLRQAMPSPTFSPLYRQIKDLMISSLEAGEWEPGALIPSEAELAGRFNVSQGTVRKAIDEMAAENLLIRRQGKGTFVATHNDPRSFYRFLRLVPDAGDFSHSRSEPLFCESLPAPAEVAVVLQVALGAPVIHVGRILSFDGVPVVLDDIYLQGEVFGGLNFEELKASEQSLYSLLEDRFGVRMIRAEENLRAVAADARSAQVLGVAEGSPLLSVERVTFTYGDKPVEWRRGLYLTAQHHYRNELG